MPSNRRTRRTHWRLRRKARNAPLVRTTQTQIEPGSREVNGILHPPFTWRFKSRTNGRRQLTRRFARGINRVLGFRRSIFPTHWCVASKLLVEISSMQFSAMKEHPMAALEGQECKCTTSTEMSPLGFQVASLVARKVPEKISTSEYESAERKTTE